ncbi:MAG: dihydrolipoamide acetyltransferase family protein [Eubacteriales bacterium]
MATAVIMPRQGQSVESCVITTWAKKKGDAVKKGDLLFSYETDKSSFDELATEDGVILDVFAEEGDDVPCLETVCVIGNPGEDYSALIPKKEGEAAKEAPKNEAPKDEAPAAAAPAAVQDSAVVSGKISPRAKNLAEKTGADLSKVAPTGPNGRIIERDIQSALDKGYRVGAVSTVVEAPATAAPTAPVAAAPAAAYTEENLSGVRKSIAKAMHASLSSMAQLTLNSSFDATALQDMRAQLKSNAEALGLGNITLNDMVLYAVSRTLLKHRDLNAHYLEDKMRYFSGVNLGIAVDTDRGLLVPTLFGADKMSLSQLSVAAKKLIAAAQSGSISPDLLQGATFTITNLGSLGIESFTPVINPPQTGILGVNTITRRIKEVDGEDVSYPSMALSLTFDHRALDGAPAARFLKDLCVALENFNLLLAK